MEETVFFCFSGNDRSKYAQSLNFHLKNFGVDVWYDYEKIFLGDNGDYVNIESGLNQSRIFVVFLSENLFQSAGAILELDAIEQNIKKGCELVIIPVFCDFAAEQLPAKYQWLTNYIYSEVHLDISSGTYDLSIDIFKRILNEKLSLVEYRKLQDLTTINVDKFLNHSINSYVSIDHNSVHVRIAVLYIMISYIIEKYKIKDNVMYFGSEFIFNKVKLNLELKIKDLICMESIFLLLVNRINCYVLDNIDD